MLKDAYTGYDFIVRICMIPLEPIFGFSVCHNTCCTLQLYTPYPLIWTLYISKNHVAFCYTKRGFKTLSITVKRSMAFSSYILSLLSFHNKAILWENSQSSFTTILDV